MKDDATVLSTQDDAEMMKRPHLWPHMLLPLKRTTDDHPGSQLETGYLSNPGPPWVVVLGTIWGGPEGGTHEYRTAEEVAADGWRVD